MIEKGCRVDDQSGRSYIVASVLHGVATLIPDRSPHLTIAIPVAKLVRVSGPTDVQPIR